MNTSISSTSKTKPNINRVLSKVKLSEDSAIIIAESVNILYQSVVSRKMREMQEEIKKERKNYGEYQRV